MKFLEGTRRVVGGAVFLALLVAAVVFYRVAPEPTLAEAAATTGTPGVDSRPSESNSATEDPSSASVAITRDEPATGTATEQDGPGVSEPGILMVISPETDGSVSVSERIVLRNSTDVIALHPPDVHRAGSAFNNLSPVARAVQISAGNQPLVVPGGVVEEQTTISVNREAGDPVTSLELRYQLEATAVRSIPSTAGRSLAAVGPLITGMPNGLPVVVIASGASVLSLSCPTLKGNATACSEKNLSGVQTNSPLPFQSAVVTMQFDEPRP